MRVYGTLESPVHENIGEVMKKVAADCHNLYYTRCMSRNMEHVGCISIGDGPIKPGSGVNKELAPVGICL